MSNIYGATALTGGGTKALDGSTYYDGDDLVDGDGAIVITSSSVYAFHLDAASGAAENSPLVISPDANAGTKRWLLKSGVFAGLTVYGNIVIPDGGTIGQADGPLVRFDNTNNYLEITGCKVGFNTTTPTQEVTINGRLDFGSNLGDVISLYGNRINGVTMYGLGVESGYLYFKSPQGFRWYAGVNADTGTSDIMELLENGNLGLGIAPKTKLTLQGTLTLKEQASADGDTAAYGQLWVKTGTPNELWFTDDAGGNHQIAYV